MEARRPFFLLRRRPLRTQVSEKGGGVPFAGLDTAQRFHLSLEEVAVGRRFLVCRGLSVLASRHKEKDGAGGAAEGRRGVAPAEVFAGRQVERLCGVLGTWGWGLLECGALLGLLLLCPGAPALFRPGPGGLPAAGGPAGPQTSLFPPAGPRGDQGQGLRHLGGRVGRKVPPAAGEQRDRCGCSLYIGVQERATQMLVGAVDIVGVRQYRWRAFAHRGGQVALLAESSKRADVVDERLPVEDPGEVLRRWSRGRSLGPAVGVRRPAGRSVARPWESRIRPPLPRRGRPVRSRGTAPATASVPFSWCRTRSRSPRWCCPRCSLGSRGCGRCSFVCGRGPPRYSRARR